MPPVSLAPHSPPGQLWAANMAILNSFEFICFTSLFQGNQAPVQRHFFTTKAIFIHFRAPEKVELGFAFLDTVPDRQDLTQKSGAEGNRVRVIAAVIEVYTIIIVEADNLRHRLSIQLEDAEPQQ